MANKPAFNLLLAQEYEHGGDKKTRWIRFGSVWETPNGNLSGTVDFFPVGGGNRIVLMPPKDGEQMDEETGEVV